MGLLPHRAAPPLLSDAEDIPAHMRIRGLTLVLQGRVQHAIREGLVEGFFVLRHDSILPSPEHGKAPRRGPIHSLSVEKTLGILSQKLFTPSDLIFDPLARRLRARPEFEILNTVVTSLPILVMNSLMREQFSTEKLFHHMPVLLNRFTRHLDPFVTIRDSNKRFEGTSVTHSLVVQTAPARAIVGVFATVNGTDFLGFRVVITDTAVVFATKSVSVNQLLTRVFSACFSHALILPHRYAAVKSDSRPWLLRISVVSSKSLYNVAS